MSGRTARPAARVVGRLGLDVGRQFEGACPNRPPPIRFFAVMCLCGCRAPRPQDSKKNQNPYRFRIGYRDIQIIIVAIRHVINMTPVGQYGPTNHRSPVNAPAQNICHVRLIKNVDRLLETQYNPKDRLRLASIRNPINQSRGLAA